MHEAPTSHRTYLLLVFVPEIYAQGQAAREHTDAKY
jgi:hypothetical protein